MRKGVVIISLVLVFVLVGIVGSVRGEGGRPTRMMISPAVARQGRTLHVAFGGGSPAAMLKVQVYPQGNRRQALTFWVQADDDGAGRFTVGVPCTWESGALVVLRVGGLEMRVPLVNGNECGRLRGWLAGWEKEDEGEP